MTMRSQRPSQRQILEFSLLFFFILLGLIIWQGLYILIPILALIVWAYKTKSGWLTLVCKAWFLFADVLHALMSRVLLTLLYFIFVLPLGHLRRRQLQAQLMLDAESASTLWKKRHKTFRKEDFARPS